MGCSLPLKNSLQPASLRYEEVRIGQVFSFERTLLESDIQTFASLTGDTSPLHVDPAYGKKTRFGKNVAHGMLAGSLFSTLIGMFCPGERSLYLSQTLQFKKPIFPGDSVKVQGTVTAKSDSTQIITLATEILVRGEKAISGEALAQFRGETP